MTTFLDRMKVELTELREKLEKLLAFIDSDKAKALPQHELALLKEQYEHMRNYADTLAKRFELYLKNHV